MHRLLWICLFTILTTLTLQSNNLEQLLIIEMSRHGARTPELSMEKVKWMRNLQPFQVTFTGLIQHFKIGEKMKQNYPELFKGITKDEITVRTSNTQRAVFSALAQLASILNSNTMQFPNDDFRYLFPNLGVETAETYDEYYKEFSHLMEEVNLNRPSVLEDPILRFANGKNCKNRREFYIENYKKYVPTMFTANPEFERVIKEAAKILKLPNELSDGDLWNSCIRMGDFVNQDVLHNKKPLIPKDTKMFKLLESCYQLEVLLKFCHPGMIPAAISAFVDELIKTLNERANGNSSLKFYLFVGHDTSLAPILTAAGILDTHCFFDSAVAGKESDCTEAFPMTAAHLDFILLRDNTTNKNFVQTVYNDKPVRICDNSEESDGYLCELSEFSVFWAEMTDSDADNFCESPKYFSEVSHRKSTLFANRKGLK